MPSKPGGHKHVKLPALVAWQTPPFRHGFGRHGLGGGSVTALPRIRHVHIHLYSCKMLIARVSKNLPISQVRPVYPGGQ
jgi:hypothetical protein